MRHRTSARDIRLPWLAVLCLAGLSAGGIRTLNLTLFHPELWSYSNPMSAAYSAEAHARLRGVHAEDLRNPAINELEVFELSIGTEDSLFYGEIGGMRTVFDEFGITHTDFETPAGHTWEFWQLCLNRLAPLLFQE